MVKKRRSFLVSLPFGVYLAGVCAPHSFLIEERKFVFFSGYDQQSEIGDRKELLPRRFRLYISSRVRSTR